MMASSDISKQASIYRRAAMKRKGGATRKIGGVRARGLQGDRRCSQVSVGLSTEEHGELGDEEFRYLMDHAREGRTETVLEGVDRDRGLLARATQSPHKLLAEE